MTRRFLALLGLLCLTASPALAQGICPNDFQGRNAALTCQCPPGSTAAGTVWGSGAYTTDSRICRAAMHAGAIGAGDDYGQRLPREAAAPVSYIHLTLPTSDLEQISVVAVS